MYLIGNHIVLSDQFFINSSNKSFIDILTIDKDDNRLCILELKNVKLSDKGLWQPIRYHSLISRSEDSIREMIVSKKINDTYIDLNPKVILVVPDCTDQLLRSISYFTDIDIKVYEVKKTIKNNMVDIVKKIHNPKTIIHKEDTIKIKINQETHNDLDSYLKVGLNIENKKTINKIIEDVKLAMTIKNKKFSIYYGKSSITITKNDVCFLNIKINKSPTSNVIKMVLFLEKDPEKFPYQYIDGIENIKFLSNKINLTISKEIGKELFLKYI
jgi:hypothetical protein